MICAAFYCKCTLEYNQRNVKRYSNWHSGALNTPQMNHIVTQSTMPIKINTKHS